MPTPTAKVRRVAAVAKPAAAAVAIEPCLYLRRNKAMLKISLPVILFTLSLGAFGQKPDTVYTKKQLARTDVQLLLSWYEQDGEHSAVTGGKGTEKLTVFAPALSFQHQFNPANHLDVDVGVDVITSASTDKIDFVYSSASRQDIRGHGNIGYRHFFKKTGLTLGGSSAISIESDYFSLGGGLSLSHQNPAQTREVGLRLQAFFDDLRWGLFEDHGRGIGLIYPAELDDKEWFDNYTRQSFNAELSISQVVNQRLILAFFPGINYQQGELATPFHRVYFNDDKTKKVENLPGHRFKIPLGIQANAFINGRWVVRAYYRWYWDDFGIRAHTADIETPVKITPVFTISPFGRFYAQTASRHFRPFGEHALTRIFYTSDYDLSEFQSWKIGLGLRWVPFKKMGKRSNFHAIGLRYAFYQRSDGLAAHTLTMLWEGSLEGKEKTEK